MKYENNLYIIFNYINLFHTIFKWLSTLTYKPYVFILLLQGRVVKKKLELHKQCEANRAYAHYRWS